MRPQLKFRLLLSGLVGATLAMGVVAGYMMGEAYTRHRVYTLAERVAAEGPTNSFTRCLTQMWEESGELDPAWKGKRRWVLTEGAR